MPVPDWPDERSRRVHWLATIGLAVLGGFLVWDLAGWVFPYHSLNHDEGVYLQQAGMLLEGQLFLRPPVEDVFRPWFFVEDGDRLYPKYGPVPAAIFALGRLLGGYRLALVGVAAGNVALVTGVVREVFDRRTGLLAAAFVLASPLFLLDSAVFLPYAPTTLLNLTFAYAYLRADRLADRRWGAVAGAAIGLAFFARPYTAVLFAAPFVAHALWSLRVNRSAALPRLATTALLGLLGVGVTLAYNAVVTGSPWLFPYQAFAPLDGLGFGHREILAHEVDYTIELALRANRRVVGLFFAEWIAGGLVGAALSALGLALAVRRDRSARVAVLAGVAATVVVGNVYFWGNYNLLGAIERPGDGLVAVLGPYYHFDLLVPTAAFAARGATGVEAVVRRLATARVRPDRARVAGTIAVVLLAGVVGAVSLEDVDRRIDRNLDATETYETAYEPFEDGPPVGSAVLLPTPYGDWLNHPFQPLRNEPGYDGDVVYALDGRPFAVADEFPDRRLYRYGHRGVWDPLDGSPTAARLQRVHEVAGSAVRLDASLGVPAGAVGATVRLETDAGGGYYVASNRTEAIDLELRVSTDRARVTGDLRPVGTGTGWIPVGESDVVSVTVFVDYGAGGGFAYRLDLPVEVADGRVRALTPRVERCRDPRACGGAATYVPASAPDGVFVRTELVGAERNE